MGLVKDKAKYLLHIEHTSSKWLNIVVFERVKMKHDCASNLFLTAIYTTFTNCSKNSAMCEV